MSSIGGEIGGKLGNQQNPYFQSAGGVTPQQQALAQYDYGQNLLEGQAEFQGQGPGGGPIMSTMATETAGGANIGKALDLAQMSDVNQKAEYGAYQNAMSMQQQNQQNALNQINQISQLTGTNSLSSLASQAGTQAGLNAPTPGSSQ